MLTGTRALAEDLAAPEDGLPSVDEALAACAPGEVVAASDRGRRVALYVLGDGRAYAVPDACPHDGGLLSDGFLDGDVLVCARHQWEFDACTGTCLARAGVERLPCRRLR